MMKLFLVCSLAFILVTFNYTTMAEENLPQGKVHHLVVFWLIKPGDSDDRAALIDATTSFRKIPGVLSVSAGLALSGDRAVVDDSFDVAITITFEDEAALASYQNHPIHVEAKEEMLKSLVDKFIVYDFID